MPRMSRRLFHISILVLFAGLSFGDQAAPPATLPPAAPQRIDFVKDIKPLFESTCVQCHAKGKDKGGFSLDARERVMKGGYNDPAADVRDSARRHFVRLDAGTYPDT